MSKKLVTPRLLTRAQAAAYCGMSVPTFDAVCKVLPILLGKDKRLERYDIIALNEWIESLKTPATERGFAWLRAMDVDDDQSPGEGDPAF